MNVGNILQSVTLDDAWPSFKTKLEVFCIMSYTHCLLSDAICNVCRMDMATLATLDIAGFCFCLDGKLWYCFNESWFYHFFDMLWIMGQVWAMPKLHATPIVLGYGRVGGLIKVLKTTGSSVKLSTQQSPVKNTYICYAHAYTCIHSINLTFDM